MDPLGLWPFDSVFVEATPPAAKPEPGELLQVVDLIDCGERSTHLQDIARLLPAWSLFFLYRDSPWNPFSYCSHHQNVVDLSVELDLLFRPWGVNSG